MRYVVTGGAGYIGGFMTVRLLEDGHEVIVIDSLERSHIESLDSRLILEQGNLLDKKFLKNVFTKYNIDAVFHFGGYISVSESVSKPSAYFANNFLATLNLLDQMVESGVERIIFSSSAAVYGNPTMVPIPESHPKSPESPYGESKWMVERILHWYFVSNKIRSVALRYFNASGAALDGSRGEAHDPETHIIPLAIAAAMKGTTFTLFGSDYETKDGTCVRDYIHVLDLVEAHVLSLQKIEKDAGSFAYNVGTGSGYSNQEIVDMVRQVSGKTLDVALKERRAGDPGELIAKVDLIKKDLGFNPKFSDLQTVIGSAWKWHLKKA